MDKGFFARVKKGESNLIRIGVDLHDEINVSGVALFTKDVTGKVSMTGDMKITFDSRQKCGDKEFSLWLIEVPTTISWSSLRYMKTYDEYGKEIEEINLNGAMVEVAKGVKFLSGNEFSKILAF